MPTWDLSPEWPCFAWPSDVGQIDDETGALLITNELVIKITNYSFRAQGWVQDDAAPSLASRKRARRQRPAQVICRERAP